LALEFAEAEAFDAGAAVEVGGAAAAVKIGGDGQGDAGLMGLEGELAGFEVAGVHCKSGSRASLLASMALWVSGAQSLRASSSFLMRFAALS
jgi:hypothetical protein